MRYFLSINLNCKSAFNYSFENTELAKHLTIEKSFSPEKWINLTVRKYDREKAGLIEYNWENPCYNNDSYFIFIGGSVLFRNEFRTENKKVPSPSEILSIITEYGDNHYKILKGNYYIILVNKNDMSIKLYSSPMFMYPAFFYFENGVFIFTNDLNAFKNFIPLTINKQGLVEMELFDHCLHTGTIYNEIKSVQGGYLLEFKDEGTTDKLVYDISKWYKTQPESKKIALPKIDSALKTCINDWADSTDTFNISLTGGFDGRLNLAFIEKEKYESLHAVQYGLQGSSQLEIPMKIAKELGFKCDPVILNEEFIRQFNEMAMLCINLTGGVTGFNRAVYPYAYNRIKDFSRSCILGQCDMIRPLYNNPAGVIFNEFSKAIFFENKETFMKNVNEYKKKSFVNSDYYTEENIDNIYLEVKKRYQNNYSMLSKELQFYFFLLKESLMKYWHTEFHIVSVYVDDYTSFADLDYLEILFNSHYAGIYKGLLAKNQFGRKNPHDLYVDLTQINNRQLNYFKNDRFIKPIWLKYGKLGLAFAAIVKKISKSVSTKPKNDTFDMENWSSKFYKEFDHLILEDSVHFNSERIRNELKRKQTDEGQSYRFNRIISQKIWLKRFLNK